VSLSFAQFRSTHPRREPVRAIVLHWTGGIGGPKRVYETLRARKGHRTPDGLSVHYVIGTDGEVVQMAPHGLTCLHAGPANEWSIGVEIVSPGLAMGAAYRRELAMGVRRVVYADFIKSTKRATEMVDFTTQQTAAVVQICDVLCDTFNITRAVPVNECGALLRREMTADELAAFSGVLGHYHCHPTKLDPGTRILEILRARWR
jgi:N-acetyl-anhydromuramyl-L-alanine amidase AmpD